MTTYTATARRGTLHTVLYHGVSKAAALREAKDWLRRLTAAEVRRVSEGLADTDRGTERRRPRGDRPESAHPYEHPHYWSAFILLGDSD